MEQIHDEKKNLKHLHSLTEFQQHWDKSRVSRKHPNKCFGCGEDSYHKCAVCKVLLHGLNSRHKNVEHCFIDYHNDGFFGLARGDCTLVDTQRRSWHPSTSITHVANLMGPAVEQPMLTRRAAAAAAAAAARNLPTGRTSEVARLPVPAADDPLPDNDEPEVVTEWV
jgi:hypothetical protein